MKKGFSTIMSAQFFSSLADNALLVAAVELLRIEPAPAWQTPALAPMFALFYVLLAPFVGAFADSRAQGPGDVHLEHHQGRGLPDDAVRRHPLLAYAVVGLGAAAYSPAKYGILTELLPPSQLVKANGWIEGLTVGSIILGILLGGQLIGPRVAPMLLGIDLPLPRHRHRHPARSRDRGDRLRLRDRGGVQPVHPAHRRAAAAAGRRQPELVRDFSQCNTHGCGRQAGPDLAGHHHAAVGRLRQPAADRLRLGRGGAGLQHDAGLQPGRRGDHRLGDRRGGGVDDDEARPRHRVLPLGIAMGFLMIGLNVITNVWVAVPFLVVLGALCGYLVVPMNALLQHRGHNLMGAGRSIAVQNFNEQACILAWARCTAA
jgi:LPLT family lysophospholipid transporter-like MFS transporter